MNGNRLKKRYTFIHKNRKTNMTNSWGEKRRKDLESIVQETIIKKIDSEQR